MRDIGWLHIVYIDIKQAAHFSLPRMSFSSRSPSVLPPSPSLPLASASAHSPETDWDRQERRWNYRKRWTGCSEKLWPVWKWFGFEATDVEQKNALCTDPFQKNWISWKSCLISVILKIQGPQFKQFQVLICLFLHHLGFHLIKVTKTGIQKITILWRNHHLFLSFCRKKRKDIRITSNQSKYGSLKIICQSSILGWESLCLNHCLDATWHWGNQPVALWELWKPRFPWCLLSALLCCWVWCPSFSSWEYPIDSQWGLGPDKPHRFSMGFRSG